MLMNRWVTVWCVVVAWSLYGCGEDLGGQLEYVGTLQIEEGLDQNVATIDHEVPHISTVPANRGELIHLAVRERVDEKNRGGPHQKVVLFTHGATVPTPPGIELRVDHYDWARRLAKSGFDVFMMDHQGMGLSSRPKMNDPCNTEPARQSELVPSPLPAACAVPYKFQLTNAKSDWDELDTVVNYIRAYRNVEKVALVSYSQGSFRVGPYVVQHPDKVESVLFFAPIFNAAGRASKPGTRFDSPVVLPVSSPAAQFGFPMTVTTKARLASAWERELACDGQQEEGVYDDVWAANMEQDPVGATWGPLQADGTPEGRIRVRNQFLWGWNNTTAAYDNTLGGSVPVLIIYGELDTQVSAAPFSPTALYSAIPGANKMMFKVACAGHFMMWERQRRVLQHISKEWLKLGSVEDFESGSFYVDNEGDVYAQ